MLLLMDFLIPPLISAHSTRPIKLLRKEFGTRPYQVLCLWDERFLVLIIAEKCPVWPIFGDFGERRLRVRQLSENAVTHTELLKVEISCFQLQGVSNEHLFFICVHDDLETF